MEPLLARAHPCCHATRRHSHPYPPTHPQQHRWRLHSRRPRRMHVRFRAPLCRGLDQPWQLHLVSLGNRGVCKGWREVVCREQLHQPFCTHENCRAISFPRPDPLALLTCVPTCLPSLLPAALLTRTACSPNAHTCLPSLLSTCSDPDNRWIPDAANPGSCACDVAAGFAQDPDVAAMCSCNAAKHFIEDVANPGTCIWWVGGEVVGERRRVVGERSGGAKRAGVGRARPSSK